MSGSRHGRSGVAGELVGRGAELAAVTTVLETASAGLPSVVLIVGEAGIGKSRLADESVARARAMGMQVLRGEADPSSREPMELWRGVRRGADVAAPSLDPTLPVEELRWEHLETLADGLVRQAPVLVVLDDLHWADPMAVWVLEHLPRALGEAPVALIATARDREPTAPPLDGLRRVSRVVVLGGLDVEGVARLAATQTSDPVDATALLARTGGNPLFIQELLRGPDGGGVIDDVLDRSLDRFDAETRSILAVAAVAGAGTPLAVVVDACALPVGAVTGRLDAAVAAGVLAAVEPAGVRFRHALLADAAGRLEDPRVLHERLATAWDTVNGLDARATAAAHRLRAAAGNADAATTIETARDVAAELVDAGEPARAAGLLQAAREVGAGCVDRPDLRADIALDLADVLAWPGDLDPAASLFQEAAELARRSADPVTRARAAIGVDLWAAAFVPDPDRVRHLEQALEALPPGQVRLRTALLRRLTVVGGADVDATDRVRAWADEAVALARTTGDPVLVAQSLLDQTMSPTSRAELDESLVAAEEVVRLADHAGRSDLALNGHQRLVGHHLDHGDLGAANRSLARAELLAELQPTPVWRQRTMVQRTTLLAVSGSRSAATTSMYEAARTGVGHTEPVVLLGCEMLHHLMLLDLYGQAEPRAEEVYRTAAALAADVPSPVLQVMKGFGAQLFGDEATVQEVVLRYGPDPDLLLRAMTGEHLLRVLGDTVARAGASTWAGPVYRTLLPFAGLLNVGGGHSAGLPVDDVLGRLAALDGDPEASVRHAGTAVAFARSIPSPPLLVHCLDHLADALERAGEGDGDPQAWRAEADALAASAGVLRPGPRSRPADRGLADRPANASLRREGAQWHLSSPMGSARLPDGNGIHQLGRLLAAPGIEITAIELSGRSGTPVAADLGPGLDARAKREYRRRLLELQAEVDDAEAAHDPVRSERAHVEVDALLRELKRAVGLGGRDRPTGSDAERARINVARSLRRALAAISEQAPLLGAHLDESVRTGGHCLYLPGPDRPLVWSVESADLA